jgi:hypothetical protein
MPEYEQRFAENGIDISVFSHLTDQDLKDVGVLLGHRRKMLAAIPQLDDMSSASAPAPASTPPTVVSTASAANQIAADRLGRRKPLSTRFRAESEVGNDGRTDTTCA